MKKKYFDQVLADVKAWAEDNRYYISFADFQDADDFAEYLNDTLWAEDSVTGNGSGSYTFNSAEAKDHVINDMETVAEALREFCTPAEEIGNRFLSEDWEWLDVTARCYILGQAISQYIEDNKKEIEQAIEEAQGEELEA
jgi:hypothetical protein